MAQVNREQPDESAAVAGSMRTGSSHPVWHIDPTEYALRVAHSRRTGDVSDPPEPLCTEVGRRILALQFTFSRWVLRRVEKVAFDRDRRVLRRTTIELNVPPEAPEFVMEASEAEQGQKHYWLVPLSVMSRRTLVNLDLRDERGETIRMLGLRFTQAVDEAMLRAAALIELDGESLPPELALLITQVVSGGPHDVAMAKLQVNEARGEGLDDHGSSQVSSLKDRRTREVLNDLDSLFAVTLERLWHNFTLYALLPVDRGRQRLIRLSVDEPTAWKMQKPALNDHEETATYRPFAPPARAPALSATWTKLVRLLRPNYGVAVVPGRFPVGSTWGLTKVRLRFLTPSAENCASYHFEFTAPPDVRIARATLLAGRPQLGATGTVGNGVTVDELTPLGPTAGLHAVEVPNGSLCRAQIDLRIPTQGWLSTLLITALACLTVVLSVFVHAVKHGMDADQWSQDQVTNIVLLLVTVSAGSATYVAHQHTNDAAVTMVRGLRFVGALMMAMPALVAGGLVYLGESEKDQGRNWTDAQSIAMRFVVGVSLACFLLILGAWLAAWGSQWIAGAQRKKGVRRSSWDMTAVENVPSARTVDQRGFRKAMKDLGFDRPAIGFYTAEGWHERYRWNDDKQSGAVAALRSGDPNPTGCTCRTCSTVPQGG